MVSMVSAHAAIAVATLLVIACVWAAVGFLRGRVSDAGGPPLAPECEAWLRRRQRGLLQPVGAAGPALDPQTGRPYTTCGAAARVIEDARAAPDAPCPRGGPSARAYAGHLAALRCSGSAR